MSMKWIQRMEEEGETFVFRSVVQEVNVESSLLLYRKARQMFDERCFYWKSADEQFAFVGLGEAVTIETNNQTNTRYEEVATLWEQLLKRHDSPEKSRPILFGGFSFDPRQKISSEWDHFPSATFSVPEIQWTSREGKEVVAFHAIGTEEETTQRLRELQKKWEMIEKAPLQQLKEMPSHLLQERQVDRYERAVQDTVDKIRQNEAKKVVIARSLQLQFEDRVPVDTVLQAISEGQPNSYHFALPYKGSQFIGATPERLIEVKKGKVLSACVAGSIRRGATEEEDEQLGNALWNDEKNRIEHDYVVQMIRSVVSNYCTTYDIPQTPEILKIRDIQHLFTPVSGVLKEGVSIFDWVRELHPTPALGGVPTDVALNMILQNEQMDRGYYAAPIGWTDATGDGEFAVAIRSTLIDDSSAYLYAGGGLVEDSTVQTEYEETWVKFRPMLRALGGQVDELS